MTDKILNIITIKNVKHFQFIYPFSSTLNTFIKRIPTSKYLTDYEWICECDFITAKYAYAFAKKFDLEISDTVLNVISDLKREPELITSIPGFSVVPRKFQLEGITKIINFKNCLLADQMGTGKTLQAIASAQYTNSYPCLIICPASLKINWQLEIIKWLNEPSTVINGRRESRYDDKFIIINYDILNYHIKFLNKINFKCMIVDECHSIKNNNSKRTKIVKKLSKQIPMKIMISGTPILNKPSELISQLEALGVFKYFGGYWTFVKQYCNANETRFGWDISGVSNSLKLHEKLKEFCMVRRLKSEVLSELPEKQRSDVPIDIDNSFDYNNAKNDFKRWIKQHSSSDTSWISEYEDELKSLGFTEKEICIKVKIRQTLISIKSDKAEALKKLETLKQLVADGKMNKTKEWISNFIESDEKLIVFAVHKKIQNEIYTHFKDKILTARIHSDDDSATRNKNIQMFQENPNCKLIVCSLVAGGVGLTLTASSTVLFVEFGWTSSIHDQAEDRAHRIGQKNSVNIYYLYGIDTIDEYILELIESKRNISNSIIDGLPYMPKDDDLNQILERFM